MSWGNKYFEVVEPFRYYRQRGSSPSNVYIGSSQMYLGVHQALNAKPGQVFHALVGGLWIFDADGKNGSVAKLTAPKPPLEKEYLHRSPGEILEGLAKQGLVRQIPQPTVKVDYIGSRDKSMTLLAPNLPQIEHVEDSPELSRFKAEMASFEDVLKVRGGTYAYTDHTENSIVRLRATLDNEVDGGAILDIKWAFLPDFYSIDLRNSVPLPTRELRAALAADERLDLSSLQKLLAGLALTPEAKP